MFGAGYVGLVTGACFAKLGHDVICMDIDPAKIEALKKGQSPIYEPGLTEIIQETTAQNRLRFTTNQQEAIDHGQVLFIAVGTPSKEDGSADLRYVFDVADTIGATINDYKLIVDKSTVPVGTADAVRERIQKKLQERNKNIAFDVASNPEFLKEGAAIKDFLHPDRIVLGVASEQAKNHLLELYNSFPSQKILMMDIRSAELSKYAANAMLATRISFMNEMSKLAEALNADIENVRVAIGADDRIGPRFLYPGCGYGGSCFPKDVSALAYLADQLNIETTLIDSVMQVNDKQKQVLFEKLQHYFKNNLGKKTIAVWGIAFKPNTDDIREAASRVLIEKLWQAGVKVKAYDPVAAENFSATYGQRADLQLCQSPLEAAQEADALIIVTEWDEFRNADLTAVKKVLLNPVIFDGRNIYDPKKMQQLGFDYFGIGRGQIKAE
jgi:UDPglucose 6-dehydrogenase